MKSLLSSKKGQVDSLAPAIIALVLAAVFLVFGLVITQELRDVDTLKNQATVTNETNAWLNETTYTLDSEDGEKTDSFSLTAIFGANGTNGYTITIPLANATVVGSTGAVTNATTVTNDNVSYSYTYQTGEEAWDAGNTTVSGLGTFADFWEIIVLAIIISIVIGLLLATFGGSRRR